MDDTCVVCAEALEWVAYGPCGHREVCSTCVARLRFICNDRRCCLCKFESSTVFVTKALGDYTNVIKDFSILPSDPKEGRVGPFWYHEGTQAYFDDSDHFKMIKETCKLTCSECDREYEISDNKLKRNGAFADIEKLKSHLFHRHNLLMCNLCLEARKVFICEQKLFTRAQLNQHISTGSSEIDGSENERGGFNGHPSCRFCRNHFYGDNELYLHMSTEHYTCHICLRQHPGQYDYYNNYNDLENHFRADHFFCEDEACLAKKFVVFVSESEIKRHNALEHGGQMSRFQRNAALQIPVSFQFRETSEQERRRRRRGSHFGNENQSTAAVQVNSQPVDGDVLPSSSYGAIGASNEYRMHRADAIGDHFETMTISDPPAQIYNQTPLGESSFPPLPTVQGSSQKKSKNKSARSSMAAHLRQRSDLYQTASGHPARVTPVVNLRGTTTNNAWLTPSSAASSLNKHVLISKSTASASSNHVQVSRPKVPGSLIGDASSSSSSVIPSLAEGGSGSAVPTIRSSSSRAKGKSPVEGQPSTHVDIPQHANKQLVEKIRSILQFDNDKYAAFKEISLQFRQGLMDSGEYLLHVHQFGISDLVPELAKLLPDSQKQKELIDTYNYNFKENGLDRVGVGQSTSHLFPRNRKGKDKLRENGTNSSRSGSSAPSYAHLIKEASDAKKNTKGKSKVSTSDELENSSLNAESQLNWTVVQPQSVITPLQISEPPGPSSKKVKKKPKFLRARLGDDAVEAPPEQLAGLGHANAFPSSAVPGPVSEKWASGAWVNGGGRKLVANLSYTEKGAKK